MEKTIIEKAQAKLNEDNEAKYITDIRNKLERIKVKIQEIEDIKKEIQKSSDEFISGKQFIEKNCDGSYFTMPNNFYNQLTSN